MPSSVHLGCAPEDLEVARDDVDLHVEIADRADVCDDGLVRVVRERDDHPVDSVLRMSRGAGRTAQKDRKLRELVVELRRPVVDETHEVDPYRGGSSA